MDILDILIAKKKSFTGETETLVNRAKKAMNDANDVIERVSEVEDAAEAAAASAADAAEEWAEMREDITSAAETIVDSKIAELDIPTEIVENIQVSDSNTSSIKSKILNFWKKGQQTTATIVKNYTATGQNEDGSMTQKAITDAVNSASPNLGIGNKGKMTKVGADGKIVHSTLTEQQIIDAINGGMSPTPTPDPDSDILGIVIDYENKSITRCEDASTLTPGANFDAYSMFGGRKRCNVNANGTITAWYGDSGFKEDGTNGDVMVYQPKFYYQRTINKYSNGLVGKIIRKETLLLSEKARTGFKLHPRFKDTSGNTLEYILLPAYEASAYDISNTAFINSDSAEIDFDNDYLFSRASIRPITGNNMNATNAEKLATNKGTGWHIIDMGALSINQMLFMVEYGTLNSQSAIGQGIDHGGAVINTGETSGLGNNSGESAQYQVNAVSYRGCENIWGNIWKIIGGFNIQGDNTNKIGIPYIATSFNYNPATLEGYDNLGFNISKQSSWISAMGYGNSDYDWVYLPIECSGGNSAVPVGDNLWTITNYNQISVVAIGGSYTGNSNNGIFYYAGDHEYTYNSNTYGTAIMFVPTKNTIYNNNYNAWLTKMGG